MPPPPSLRHLQLTALTLERLPATKFAASHALAGYPVGVMARGSLEGQRQLTRLALTRRRHCCRHDCGDVSASSSFCVDPIPSSKAARAATAPGADATAPILFPRLHQCRQMRTRLQ